MTTWVMRFINSYNALHSLDGRHFVFRGASRIQGWASQLNTSWRNSSRAALHSRATHSECRLNIAPSRGEAKAKLLLIRLDAEGGANALGGHHAGRRLDDAVELVLGEVHALVLDASHPEPAFQ